MTPAARWYVAGFGLSLLALGVGNVAVVLAALVCFAMATAAC